MNNEYLDLLNTSGQPPGQPDDGANPYTGMLEEVERQKKVLLSAQVQQAVKTNPDQYSTSRRVAGYLGYPVAAVEAKPELKQQAQAKELQQNIAGSPLLQQRYTDADFAKLAHDDSFTLADIGEKAKKFANYVFSADGEHGLVFDFGSAAKATVLGGTVKLGARLLDLNAAAWDLVGGSQYAAASRKQAKRADEAADQVVGDSLAPEVREGFYSLGQNLTTLPLGLERTLFQTAEQSGKAVATVMGVLTGAQSFSQARDKGLGVEQSALYGVEQGTFETLFEMTPAKTLFKDLAQNQSLMRTLRDQLIHENVGEQLTTLAQDFTEWMNLNPEKSVGDFLRERPEAAYQTLVGTLIGVVGQSTLMHHATRLQEKLGGEAYSANRALEFLDAYRDMQGQINASKLGERAPDVLAKFVNDASGNAQVRFDAATLVETFQQAGISIEQALPSVNVKELMQQAATGGEVSVPLSEVTVGTRGTDLEQTLPEHMRFGTNELSASEAKIANQTAQERLQAQIDEAVAKAQEQDAFRASADVVHQNILQQLQEAGRFRESVNTGMAQWVTAFYSTMASRLGTTPEEMYARYPLRALAQATGKSGPVMDQKAVAVTDQVDETTGLPLNSDGTVTVYHHTSRANADAIAKSGKLKAAAEPDVYVTTRKETDTGYGDTAVAIRVNPELLQIDDEFPDGRRDFRISAGKPGGVVSVDVGEPQALNQTAQPLPDTIEIDGKQRPTTNSNGQPIAATEEGVRNFWKWFGDSKVVDKDGKPLVVYHGTNVRFDVFDPAFIGLRDAGFFGTGFYFTPDENAALDYADTAAEDSGKGEPAAMPLYVSLQNPFIWDMSDEGADATREALAAVGVKRTSVRGNSAALGNVKERETFNRAARKQGYDGVIVSDEDGVQEVVAFSPNQIKSAIGNSGEFDPTNPSILAQGPRGTFNPQTLELVLNHNADLSTWFHESGHFYLEVMADIASQPDAPAQIVEDMGKVLKWFGVADLQTWNAMTLDEQRRYHERFAESIEQYIMEGKAPSLELAPAFRRFRAWLLSVYQSLKQFLSAKRDADSMPLNDDVRRVFDRMLATDEQIQQANEVAALVPDANADGEAMDRLQKRSMADLKWTVNARDKVIKKLRKQAATIEKEIREQVTEEVNQMPEVLAAQALKKAEAEHEASPNSADFNAATIADAYGFASVDAMYTAIDRFGKKQDVIDGMTERRMLEEHGDLIDDRAIEQAANEAIHNEARMRSLATELRTQREMLNVRDDTGKTNAAGVKITVNALVEASKIFGANVASQTVLKDLKQRIWSHTAAERRAGKAWQEATAAGKTQEAIKAKQDQMLQNAATKALIDAKDEAAKAFEFFKRVVKGNDEAVVAKGRDADIVNAARAVLAAYGVETTTTKAAADYLEVVSKNDPETFNVIQPMVEGALKNAQPLESLTVDQMRALHEEVQALWFLAKRSRQMEVDGDLMDIADAANELHTRLEEIGIPDTVPGETSALTEADKRKRWVQFAGALLRRVEQWTEKMDGEYGGPFLRYVFQPIKDAAERYRSDRIVYRKKLQALADAVAPSFTHKLIDAPELGYTFGKGHNGIGHAELLHAILHTGNESNLRKLLIGRGWGELNADGTLNADRWTRFIQRLADEGVLKQEHFDFAQGVWDLLEEMKPLAQKAHRDVFGRYFAEVTADEFVDPFGVTRRGGYVPAQADPLLVNDADMRALAELENENMAYSFPATSRGFTKSRVEYNRPLKLDLRTLPQHIDKVLLFSNMEPAVRGVTKLLRNKSVSQPLNRIDPSAYSGMLLPWLNRSARQIVETPIPGDGGASRVLSTLRSRAGAALMFANLSNTVQQVTGFLSAGVKVEAGHLMRGAAQMIAHPKQTADAVRELSEFMRNRMDGDLHDMTESINAIVLDQSLYEKAQAWSTKHTYFLQSALDNAMGPMIWIGAYNQALQQGMEERMAVRFADGVIRQTQGATNPEDVSRIETGPAYARMFTQFAGYFNMLANTNATALQQIASEMGLRKGAGKALGVLVFGVLAPIWAAEAIAQAFKGGPDDPDHDGYLDDWLAAVFGMGTIKGLFAYVPFVGQLAAAGVNKFNGNPNDDRVSLSPAVSMLESAVSTPKDVYDAIQGKANGQHLVNDAATLISMVTGLPARAFARPAGYALGVEQDKIEPTGPVDAARGLATGTASPESKR